MSIFSDIGNLYKLISLIRQAKETKMDIKTVAGVIKIVGYIASLAGLVFGYMKPETVLAIVIILSAVVKLAEAIVKVTPSTTDDELIAKIVEELKKNNLIKE